MYLPISAMSATLATFAAAPASLSFPPPFQRAHTFSPHYNKWRPLDIDVVAKYIGLARLKINATWYKIDKPNY